MLRALLGKGRRVLEQASGTPADATSDSTGEEEQEEVVEEDVEYLETWKDWLQRTTQEVRAAMEKLNMDDWVTTVRKRQWRWASRVVNHKPDRWTSRVLHWQLQKGLRKVGHPKRRWVDPIEAFAVTWTGIEDAKNAWVLLHAHAAGGITGSHSQRIPAY